MEIEKLMKRDCVCMKALGMDRVPDHSTIDRFIRKNHGAIEGIMAQSIGRLRELDGHVVFQDGTKIESAAEIYVRMAFRMREEPGEGGKGRH